MKTKPAADRSIRSFWRSLFFFATAVCLSFSLIACGSNGQSNEGNGGDEATVAENTNQDQGGNEEPSNSDKEDDSENSEKGTKKRRERTISVNAARAVQSDLVVPIIAEGTIRARHSAEIRTELEGRLIQIYAEDGQSVRKGQLIAKLDSREYEVAAEEARAKYLEALSLLAVEEDSLPALEIPDELQEKFEELRRLEKKGLITREERLAREIALEVEALRDGIYRVEIAASRSGVSAARTALERARLTLERTEIRAPFSGVVTGLVLSQGEQVTKGQQICTLVNNVDIEAEVGVLEADMSELTVGRPAFLIFPAVGETLQAEVDVVSPQFDRDTRTCQVLLRFRSENGSVRPGMFVRAVIAGRTYKDRLLVPKEAILTREGRPLLFKVEDDRTKWLYLQLGERNDYLVEVKRVLQGGTLAPGDLVIVTDHLTLAHDAKVKVKKVVGISDPWSSVQEDT
ncbi:MAG: efflux RND transporter periplasmic adaptor subunit [Candidatus Latescibacteria bacterium]|nr:efflux RND transporter periplasmic adaptor subunit [Candidatus Latescibacterota bacterium]NIM21426.1 efflux RND transporter periplasmic adaptor subunit [Candidatus Latescibacterota bacterium]NIM65607.1 efflux RND transporter periplasmic adaptor subunit [Candidatus Latescibacterota bacterium]NIO01987.1 efflux RND transporter periplasmic adaptor subunit [Candidatus Latescibacterota bacterium]NIO28799.1 efflux RND transporter periplasmic adaptor subunit [Candidatus Latescibacterota bacterium]